MHELDPVRHSSNTKARIENAMIFRWTRAILAILFVAIVLVMTVRTLFDFHYPRGIDNDPLLEPYHVLSVQDNMLHLEDGRVVLLHTVSGQLNELIESAGSRIDLEMDRSEKNATVFVKSKFAGCGDPFATVRWLFPPYRIPLFPDDYLLNYRDCIDDGQFVANHGNPTAEETR